MAYKIYKGFFHPNNIGKYKGDHRKIVFRSRLEWLCMQFFDTNSNILEWSNEEIIVLYKSPLDGRTHRYFPDFWVKTRDRKGNINEMMIEVKPLSQTKEPKKGKNEKRYLMESKVWVTNNAKWEAATEYCKKRGWQFQIITEKDINGTDR